MEKRAMARRKPQFKVVTEDTKTSARTGVLTTSRDVTADTPFGLV